MWMWCFHDEKIIQHCLGRLVMINFCCLEMPEWRKGNNSDRRARLSVLNLTVQKLGHE